MSREVIKLAIDQHWNRLNERWAREFRVSAGHLIYLNEVATVSINLGRRSGHTSTIIENAVGDDLVVTSSFSHAKEIKRQNRNLRCISFGSRSEPWRGLRVRRIWFDNWSYFHSDIPRSDFEYAYVSLLHTYPEQIIRLG